MNIRKIIKNLQEMKDSMPREPFDDGVNYGADRAIDLLRELEKDIKQKILHDHTTPVKQLLLKILGEEEGK